MVVVTMSKRCHRWTKGSPGQSQTGRSVEDVVTWVWQAELIDDRCEVDEGRKDLAGDALVGDPLIGLGVVAGNGSILRSRCCPSKRNLLCSTKTC